MKDLLIRSFLFFAVIALFIAANSISTNSSHFGDNNTVPPIAKYVTPYGTGDHSGSGWSNAYSLNDMKSRLTSNTTTTEKPLLQVYDSYIAGGKGIGITQNADPLLFQFYSDVQNDTIVALRPDRRPLRIEMYDAGTQGKIYNNILVCNPLFDPQLCPVGECNTPPNSVVYEGNRWKIGNDWQPEFCSEPISNCTSED